MFIHFAVAAGVVDANFAAKQNVDHGGAGNDREPLRILWRR